MPNWQPDPLEWRSGIGQGECLTDYLQTCRLQIKSTSLRAKRARDRCALQNNCDLTETVTVVRRAGMGYVDCWVRNEKEFNSATAQVIPLRNETAEASRNICEESAIMPGQESHVKLAIWDLREFGRWYWNSLA